MKSQKEYIVPYDTIVASIEDAKKKGFTQEQLAFAYARVSTKKKEQELSRENQSEDCVKYAHKNGQFLIHVFECSESAKKQGRKVFNAVLQTCLDYKIKNIILKDYSRLARNLGDKHIINELVFEKKRLAFHFYLYNKILDDSSADEMFVSDLMAAFDTNFSRTLSVKMKHSYKNKKEKGIPSQLPMGLQFNEKNKSIIEIDPNFEAIINELFSLYLYKEFTLEKITEYFNAAGYKTRRGDIFHESTVQRLLTNKIFVGRYFWVKDEGYIKLSHPFEGYITDEQYDEIQRLIKSRSKGSKSRKEKPYLLSKLILCSKCDCFASGNRPEGYIYYTHKCKNNLENPKPYWKENELLERIDSEVVQMIYNEKYTEFLKERLKKLLNVKSTTSIKNREDITNQIKVYDNKINKLLNEFLDATDSDKTRIRVKEKIQEYDNNILILREREKTLTVDMNEYRHDVIQTIDAVRDFSKLYSYANKVEKIKLLREMISWIKFDGEKLEIIWKKPFDILLHKSENIIRFPSTKDSDGNLILSLWVTDGARTRNDWYHKPGLYH